MTGGNTRIPNFDERMRNSLRPILLVDSELNVIRPTDIALDSWRGMAKWSRTNECAQALVTRAEYDQQGGEWIKPHGLGNV